MNNSMIFISVVIPVFKGESTLEKLITEILPLTFSQELTDDIEFKISEVIFVHDCGPDNSDFVIDKLVNKYDFISAVWLTKNFGQHPATLAGMANATGDWIVTIDEDGQHNPQDIAKLLRYAIEENLQIVYAQPINNPPHGFIRNQLSKIAKNLASRLLGDSFKHGTFNSFRIIYGEIGRVLAAYCGNGIYLDVGLSWIANRIGFFPILMRGENRPSGYSFLKLIDHFFKLVLTAGTAPLRLITLFGVFSLFLAIGVSLYALYGRCCTQGQTPGWTSLVMVIAFFSGFIMISLGIIAEYLTIVMSISLGKPLYVASSKPSRFKIK